MGQKTYDRGITPDSVITTHPVRVYGATIFFSQRAPVVYGAR